MLSSLLLPLLLLLEPAANAWQIPAMMVPKNHPSLRPTTTTALSARAEASFGMGCFWKPSEEMLKVPGVIDTVVGYTGVPNVDAPPTYDKVCFSRDWVEGVRVYYDDDVVSYETLLEAFFEHQEPKWQSRQYASIIFPHDEQQEATAKAWLENGKQKIRDDGITTAWTQVEPLQPFFAAENYHQRYWQKTRPRIATMIALLAVSTGIVDQFLPTAAAVSTVHSAADAIVLAGLVLVFVERVVDTKTVEI